MIEATWPGGFSVTAALAFPDSMSVVSPPPVPITNERVLLELQLAGGAAVQVTVSALIAVDKNARATKLTNFVYTALFQL